MNSENKSTRVQDRKTFSSESELILKITDLRFTYSRSNFELGPITFYGRNENIGLLGHNGAGKTTLLRILKGLISQNTGTINLLNRSTNRSIRRNLVSFVEDNPSIPSKITGKEYLKLVASLSGLTNHALDVRLERLREVVPFPNDLRKKTETYSKGNKKLLALLSALLVPTPILLLDEPFEGLDQLNLNKLYHFLEDPQRFGYKTVIISSHILPYLVSITDTVIILINGKIAEISRPLRNKDSWEIIKRNYDNYLLQFLEK